MSIYVQKDELNKTYTEAARVSEDWYKPFDEYERLAGNKLSKKLSTKAPRWRNGTRPTSGTTFELTGPWRPKAGTGPS